MHETEVERHDSRHRRLRRSGARRAHRLLVSALLAVATVFVTAGTTVAAPTDPERPCDVGVFCAWSETDYQGDSLPFDLRSANMEECIPLGEGFEARSFANRMDRPITVYQHARCATVADFTTYPGGTFVPETPYVVRAIQIWTH